MRHWIKIELLLVLVCLAMNGLAAWATVGYPDRVEVARQTPPPDGMVYLDTCDGRPTDTQAEEHVGCLADYPGEFSRGVVGGLSLVLFVLGNFIYAFRRQRSSPS